jgi:hypothetical protein
MAACRTDCPTQPQLDTSSSLGKSWLPVANMDALNHPTLPKQTNTFTVVQPLANPIELAADSGEMC